ncbi:hypothetical protein N2152v2_011048 [Parachlorella kessleri]
MEGPSLVGQDESRSSPLGQQAAALEEAVQAEDYAAAAMLRDSLRQMDPSAQAAAVIAGVKRQLRAAVAEEAYQASVAKSTSKSMVYSVLRDAAQLRDHLVDLLGEQLSVQEAQPHNEALVGLEMRGLPSAAEEVSHGVRVQVKSQYIKWQSRPRENQFVFGCTTRIVNEGPSTIQLRSSHWHVLDAELGHQDISGAGALGEQVVLRPGEAYEFQPSCLLPTPAGVVEGRFEVWTLCAGSAGLLAAGWGEPFEVAIPRVGLKFEVNEDGSVA